VVSGAYLKAEISLNFLSRARQAALGVFSKLFLGAALSARCLKAELSFNFYFRARQALFSRFFRKSKKSYVRILRS
jgi:hypothetical protein